MECLSDKCLSTLVGISMSNSWHSSEKFIHDSSSTAYTCITFELLGHEITVAWSVPNLSDGLFTQAKMLKAYPAKLSLTTLQCLMSTIQTGVIAAALDRNINSWRVGWNVQLISVIYCVGSSSAFFIFFC